MITDSSEPDGNKSVFEERKVAVYIKKLLENINQLHSRNIVHLDINPENIILDDKTGKMRLVGFTHAKCLKPDTYTNSVNELIYHDYGQVEYVSPEVVEHNPVTLNTDMWSVGVLAYVLLSGKSPFYGSHPKETLCNIRKNSWSFGDDFSSISHEAKDFIQKLFVLEPKERMNVEQALNHPWIHYASQQTVSPLLEKHNLMQLHSRQVWSKQAKQMQPWLKLIKISKIMDDLDLSDTGISSGISDSDKEEKPRKSYSSDKKGRIRSESIEELNQSQHVRISSDDEESLNPGTYLLPVKDPLFTVRLREYRRTRYEKVKQIETLLINKQQQRQQQQQQQQRSSITTMTEIRPYNQKTVKERYFVDVYGKCVQRGSLSRSTDQDTLFAKSITAERESKSPSVGKAQYSSSGSAEVLAKPFQHFIDQKYDKRSIIGEGSAPIIREKLKDMFLIVGATVTLRCRIEGNPTPRCFWYHNDRLIIGDDDRFKFAQAEDGVTTLSINKARVSDIGVYRCAARNQFGISLTKAKLTVGDTPDRPTRPIVAQYSSDQVYLIWESPSFNGNSDILCYKIDYKTSGDVKWSNALYTIQECCLIKNLEPLSNYRFRVSCINTIGISSYSWASEEVTTLAPGESKITIDHSQVEKLLKNQYNLEKRSQQLVLVRKLDEDSSLDYSKKVADGEVFRLKQKQNPKDLYAIESRLYKFGDVCLSNALDNANRTKKLVKLSTKLNDNEIKILRELREQDRLVQLVEGFEYETQDAEKTYKFVLVYAHAVPVIDFISMKHKYSEELVVKILRQLLDAVQWIHLHGYVHLNIHPLSVLNSNLTHCNVKLSGFENSIQIGELAKETEAFSGEGACALSFFDQLKVPVEFSGNFF
jgi:serine/threonine protein kinase